MLDEPRVRPYAVIVVDQRHPGMCGPPAFTAASRLSVNPVALRYKLILSHCFPGLKSLPWLRSFHSPPSASGF